MPEPWLGRHSWILRDIGPRDDDGEPRETNAAPSELTIDITVNRDDPSRVLKFGSQLDPLLAEDLTDFL